MASNIQNPYLPSPSQADAWAEGFMKGFLSISSPQPSDRIFPEDYEAFNTGVATGLTCADGGITFGNPCIPYLQEQHDIGVGTGMLWTSEVAHSAIDFFLKPRHVGFGLAGLVILLIEVGLHTTPDTDLPETVLPALGQRTLDILTSYGISSLELFCGVGEDYETTGCEIYLTPLFTSLEKARNAASKLGRSKWAVVSWRNDQSGSFKIVDLYE